MKEESENEGESKAKKNLLADHRREKNEKNGTEKSGVEEVRRIRAADVSVNSFHQINKCTTFSRKFFSECTPDSGIREADIT